MKIEKFLDVHILTGVVFGLLIGLYHPMEAYKGVLTVVALILGLKVVGVLK